MRWILQAGLSTILSSAARIQEHEMLNTTDQPLEHHTFGNGECHCSVTASNRNSCCSASGNAGMGTGTFCGNSMASATCSKDNPVCCTSHAAGSVCCPEGSQCSRGCRGDGGIKDRDGGRCQCLLPPKKSKASETVKIPLAEMFAYLAQASYCGPDHYSPNWQNLAPWECKEECAVAGLKLRKGSIRRITREDKETHNATFAYVGVFESVHNGKGQGKDAPKTGDCVIGFAGSITKENWQRNFQFNKREASKEISSFKQLKDENLKFHTGFMKTWHTLSADGAEGGVLAAVNALGCGPGSGRTVFPTGQSLGAAVASIALSDLHLQGYKTGLTYVFNSPRVGNKRMRKLYRKLFDRPVALFRMTNRKDPVPRLTPSANGFRHVGAELYYPLEWPDRTNKDHFVVCEKEEDKHCSNRYSVIRTLAGGDDHCVNPLIKEGNICALAEFCNDPLNPMVK